MIQNIVRYEIEFLAWTSTPDATDQRGSWFVMELEILRKAAGLTQRQLAELAGVDDSAISLVETGKRDIGAMSYYSVVRIGRVLVPTMPIERTFPVPAADASTMASSASSDAERTT